MSPVALLSGGSFAHERHPAVGLLLRPVTLVLGGVQTRPFRGILILVLLKHFNGTLQDKYLTHYET